MADLGDLFYHFRGEYSMNTMPTASHTDVETPAIEVNINDRAATREAIIYSIRKKGHDFVPRSDWRAVKGDPKKLSYGWDYTMIAIHHAGRSYICSSGLLQMQEIQKTHIKGRGSDVGYHYGIDCNGTILEGRDIRYKGEHLNQFNTGVIGIVLLEDLTEPSEGDDAYAKIRRTTGMPATTKIPPRQVESLEVLIKILQEFFKITTLGGHREYQNNHDRTCPGNLGIDIVNKLRKSMGLSIPVKG